MVARKRPLSGVSTEDVPAPKMAKANTDDKSRDLFELKVKIPPAGKASQDNWKPLTPANLKMLAITNGNPTSPLMEQEPKEISGNADEGDFEHISRSNEGSGDDGDMDENSNVDYYLEHDWLEIINISAFSEETNTNVKPDCEGSCYSVLIRRDQMRRNFHQDISEQTGEISAMGFSLFDRYGRLKPGFKRGSARSGSGLWVDELDRGDIFLIEHVEIDKRYRGQGLGQDMVRTILQKALAKSDPRTFIAIIGPAAMNSEIGEEFENKSSKERSVTFGGERHRAESFWRSLGFRRIGFTEWFACLPRNFHFLRKCHSLPAHLDLDPRRPATCRTNAIFKTLLQAFETTKDDTARLGLTQKALESYEPKNKIWRSADRDGNTLLHHAATSENPKCVKWIIEKCPRLLTARNDLWETPLDACQAHLEVIRTEQKWTTVKSIAVSDRFTGYSQQFVEILCALKGLSNPSLEELLRLKYGCTCGQCQEGFLSPRMRFALLRSAETTSDMLLDGIGNTDGNLFLEEYRRFLKYVQPSMHDNMHIDMGIRKGFANMFKHFAQFLQNSTEPPRELKILEMVISKREGSSMAKRYLDYGGTVDAVGSALFRTVMDKSQSAGDGTTWNSFAADLEALPACRNDDEFGFVSGMCGYKRVRQGQCFSATGRRIDEYDF